jgi:hypothetical protein
MATLSTATDSDAAKGGLQLQKELPMEFMDLSIAVLLPVAILEGMLLGSFHWRSNEEILTLTLWGMCLP